MAFNNKYLGKQNLNFGGLAKLWVYDGTAASGSSDTIANINTAGFMNAAYKDLAVNDIITVIATDGIFTAIVNQNNVVVDAFGVIVSGAVDITDGVQITATDTD